MSRVLVIEDNPADLDLVTYLLEFGGHTVTKAHGGQEGIGAAIATHPDLILCDLRMPNISGFDVIARLRKSKDLKETAVVAVTIMRSGADPCFVLDAGFSGVMQKPIDPPAFLDQIAAYLSGNKTPTQH